MNLVFDEIYLCVDVAESYVGSRNSLGQLVMVIVPHAPNHSLRCHHVVSKSICRLLVH